jgi:hypothetical protein
MVDFERALHRQAIDVQALYAKWNVAVQKQIEEMRIRQWCVEQAIKTAEMQFSDEHGTDVIRMARHILDFITEPIYLSTDQPVSPTDQTAPSSPADAPR